MKHAKHYTNPFFEQHAKPQKLRVFVSQLS